jgi:flavorubredoxin
VVNPPWREEEAVRTRKIAVIYHSQSAGNTRAAAEHVVRGIKEAGEFEVVVANTNEGRVDAAVLADCAGAAFGTPDYFSYPAGGMKVFMDDWLIAQRGGNEEIKGLPIALFCTHGGGGVARGPFEELFRHVGPQVGETVMIKGHPGQAEGEACEQLGAALARRAEEFLSGGQ